MRLSKKIVWLILPLLALLVVIKPYLQAGFPYTHDGENHLARFANYKIALKEGQFPPRFAPNLLNHYGYPVFNYNYPLANILSLPFSIVKLNYELTFKIIAIGSILLGALGINGWLKVLSIKPTARVLAITTFVLSPYIVNLTTYRGNIGELMAINLLAWLFYWAERSSSQTQINKRFWPTVVWAAFLLSHNIAVLLGVPAVVIYFLVRRKMKNIKTVFSFSWLTPLFLGILLSLWFWLPAIAEKSEIILDQANISRQLGAHFLSIEQLLWSPLEFGFSYPGQIDSLGLGLGLVQLLVFVVAIAWMLTKLNKIQEKKDEQFRLIALLIVLASGLAILQLNVSKVIWTLVPLANFIQFPWRLSILLTLVMSLLTALMVSVLRSGFKVLMIVVLLLQLIAFSRLKPADYFHKQIIDYDYFPMTTSTNNENMPTGFSLLDFANWQPTPEFLEGSGKITVNSWNGSKRNYNLRLDQNSLIVEPTAYFLGWETLVNAEKVDYYNSDEVGGRIGYRLPPGDYHVESRFTQHTWARRIGNFTSLATGLLLIVSRGVKWAGSKSFKRIKSTKRNK